MSITMIRNAVSVKMSMPVSAATAAVIPANSKQKSSATTRKALRTLGSGTPADTAEHRQDAGSPGPSER